MAYLVIYYSQMVWLQYYSLILRFNLKVNLS